MSAISARGLRPQSLYHCFLLMVALVMAMHVCALPTRSMVRLEVHNTKSPVPFLPDMKTAAIPGAHGYTYSFSLYYDNVDIEQTEFAITPGGCIMKITINHSPIPFRHPGGCDPRPGAYWEVYDSPLYLDLTPYLKNGRNTVEIRTRRPEFDMGPVVLSGTMRLSTWLGVAMALVACCMLIVFMERKTGETGSGIILSGGFLVLLNRLSHLGVNQFSMDLPGHITYITYIAEHWSWPKPFWGWSYYHAPLYYTICGLLVNIIEIFRSFDTYACLQLFDLGCFMFMLIFCALTLKRLLTEPIAYYTVLILMVYYPAGILYAGRIDSNMLFYLFYSSCIYITLRWLQSRDAKEYSTCFGLMFILLGLSMASRTNSLILFPLLGLAILHRWLKGQWQPNPLKHPIIRAGILVLLLGIAVSVGRTEFYRLTEIRREPFLVGNSLALSRRLVLQSADIFKLLVPDILHYFDRPFWNVWLNENGRQYFWNSMLKSSLFGEYQWADHFVAYIMNFLLMAIIFYVIDGYIVHRQSLRRQRTWWLCLISLAIPIAALMENRVLYPFSSSEDFRYIYPSLVSFCGLYGLVIQQHKQDWRPFRKMLGVVICVLFAISSVCFYWL